MDELAHTCFVEANSIGAHGARERRPRMAKLVEHLPRYRIGFAARKGGLTCRSASPSTRASLIDRHDGDVKGCMSAAKRSP
ncbi:hypothetical protein NK8_83120 (plasmid) [Caballeronia sp. NK8]|nr:hypothetical protein NK8_67820 [Caballeronia sp. NK8]BCQ30121.1 hypothetical protein NK8_83120 [Caballeronia sp. NK8]